MVALLCLFYAGEIFFQLLFLCESRAVDADEHLVFLVAAPVCARNARKLECLDGGGISHMRACAEVCEIALAEEAYRGILGQVVYQLCLVGLAHFLGKLQCLFAGKSEALELDIFLYYFLHFGFDFREVVLGEGGFAVEIVIEAVGDGGTYRELRVGIEVLYCLRENMRRGVAEGMSAELFFESALNDASVLVNDFHDFFFLSIKNKTPLQIMQ